MKQQIIKGVAVAMTAVALSAPAMASDPTQGMIDAANQIETEYDLPSGLLLSVASVESDFNPGCVTGRCRGLMQIHSSYAGAFAKAAGMNDYDLLDYKDSMKIAAYLLSDYMMRYEGDLHFALMCYNLGEYGALAKRRNGVESTSYSRKVIGRIEQYSLLQIVEVPKAEEAVPTCKDNLQVNEAEIQESEKSDLLMAVVSGFLHRMLEVLFR